jgi:hypothetical protein
MKTTRRLLQTLVLSLLFAGSAAAQTAQTEKADDWAPVKHLEFTADDIEGGVLGADGELIHSVSRAWQPSLIEIRSDFVPEIQKTMEDL